MRVLHDVANGAGWRCVLIGASVPALLVSSGSPSRVTFDADTIVSTRTWDDYEALRRALETRGFRRGAPHQMFSPEDARIDLIPFGPGIVEPSMIEGAFTFDVVPQSTFVLLKLISYQDRPEERHRDVADIVAICEAYESDSDRRYEAVGEMVDGVPVSFDLAGAFALGRDLRAIAHRDSLEATAKFFARIPDQYAAPVRHVVMEEKRTFVGDERRPQVFRLFRVLQAGIGLRSSPPA